MKIEIMAVGGYDEVGRNMTAVKIGEEVVLLDMGWNLEKVLMHFGQYDPRRHSLQDMIEVGAYPDYQYMGSWIDKVKAILISHAHLDHISAIPKLAGVFPNAEIIGTPFAMEVLKESLKQEPNPIPNKIFVMKAGSKKKVGKNFNVEFIHVTHSTPDSVMIALKTPAGTVLYTGDWKLDNQPILGKRTNMQKLKKLGEEGVKVLIADTVRIERESKTPSESMVREMLKDVLWGVQNQENAIFVTTFASHIARLKTIKDLGEKMGRKVIFLGRSMDMYINAANRAGIVDLTKGAEIYGRRKGIERALKQVMKHQSKYLVVITGHQGEPHSVLDRISRKELPFTFDEWDTLIFSSEIIPAPVNQANRAELERRLKPSKVRMFKDIHVSGHAAREDHRDLLKVVHPEHYIPFHGDIRKLASATNLAKDMGYQLGKSVHLLQNGQKIEIN
ncbi:MAG: RNase J family beta-CASP ribonuclease [Nanoarchaeota archaeon]|nr:RNase J family beta-CASP ribonuclease [Nanoarchaeota archaeon]